jgi:RimJ/RimL family protein N-acetyltransferase
VIETERLGLRPLIMSDLDDVVSMHAAPEVERFMGPFDHATAMRRLEANERDWRLRGYGLAAIIDRATGRFLGRSGLKYWPQFDETEVGWVLRADAWGHGYATEAANACVEWGFREFALPYLTAMIRPDNARSIRVAERLGMTPLRRDALLGTPVVVYCVRSRAAAPGVS